MHDIHNYNDEYDLMRAKLRFMRLMLTGAYYTLENGGTKLTQFLREQGRADLDELFESVCNAINYMSIAMDYTAEQYFAPHTSL
ncbi:MAG: hypothetical protein IJ466_11090 [Clostridia bacterium]|nr:hypothetical protein [Clostridia bacterium]